MKVESTEEEEDKRRWWVVKCGNRWRKEKRKTNVWVYLVCGILTLVMENWETIKFDINEIESKT